MSWCPTWLTDCCWRPAAGGRSAAASRTGAGRDRLERGGRRGRSRGPPRTGSPMGMAALEQRLGQATADWFLGQAEQCQSDDPPEWHAAVVLAAGVALLQDGRDVEGRETLERLCGRLSSASPRARRPAAAARPERPRPERPRPRGPGPSVLLAGPVAAGGHPQLGGDSDRRGRGGGGRRRELIVQNRTLWRTLARAACALGPPADRIPGALGVARASSGGAAGVRGQ